MLIELTSEGILVNLSQVETIEMATPLADGRGRCTITFASGSKRTVKAEYEHLSVHRGVAVPAPAGFKLIRFYKPSEGEGDQSTFFREEDILAFRIDGSSVGPMSPITVGGEPSDNDWGIVHPSGTVENWDETWGTVEAFKAAVSKPAK